MRIQSSHWLLEWNQAIKINFHPPNIYKYEPVAKSILSLLPSLDNPVYYNKGAKLIKMIGIQPKH